MISIFIVEDHEMYIEGLTLLLQKQPGIEVVGTASSGAALLAQLPELNADILLLDVHLPDINDEDLLKKIRQGRPCKKLFTSRSCAAPGMCTGCLSTIYRATC